jgi:hypothetical protein
MPKKLVILPVYHENWGYLTLLINGREYSYSCDNAIILAFIRKLRKRTINKGKLLAWFKRKAKLIQK